MTAPTKFAHVVYNTHRYQDMIDWYITVFEARVQHGDDKLTFLTYDEEHHRIALVNLGPMPDPPPEPKLGQGPESTTSPTPGTTSASSSSSTPDSRATASCPSGPSSTV